MLSLPSFSRRLWKSLCTSSVPVYSYYTNKKYTDIFPLEANGNSFYINTPQIKLPINPEVSVMEVQGFVEGLRKDLKTVEFYNEDQVIYSKTSPLALIVRDNFYIKVNNDFYYIITQTNPLIERNNSFTLDQHSIKSLSSNLGHSNLQAEVLVKYSNALLENIQVGNKAKVDCNFIRLVNRKILTRFSLESSFKTADLDDKIAFLSAKLNHLEKSKEDCEAILQKKANRRLRLITGIMLTQIAVLQYWTYYALSWDIVEPMACLLGLGEIIIGYIFWMRSNSDYNLSNIKDRFIDRRRGKAYKKLLFDQDEIIRIQKMREYLEMKKVFSSSNPAEILEKLTKSSDEEEAADK